MTVVRRGRGAGGAVFDTLELMNDPSFAERGIMQTIEHPTTGKVKMPAWPVRFDGAPPKVKPSPLLGQHVDDVLARGSAWMPRRSPPCARKASSDLAPRGDLCGF